jgi:hypothetical protein
MKRVRERFIAVPAFTQVVAGLTLPGFAIASAAG